MNDCDVIVIGRGALGEVNALVWRVVNSLTEKTRQAAKPSRVHAAFPEGC